MKRVLLPVAEVAPESVRVEGERFHYLAHVLRLRAGDAVEVFDGRGRSFDAHIESADERGATLRLLSERRSRPLRRITVVQALPKADKLEQVLQHGTELGASAFVPVSSERVVSRPPDERAAKRVERWRRIVEEAARQCGRADVPEVKPVRPLVEAVRALAPGTRTFVLDEEERALTLGEAFAPFRDGSDPVALVVGPEGGLSREEVDSLCRAGAVAVTLGRRILRTETAALAALAVLLHLDGELG